MRLARQTLFLLLAASVGAFVHAAGLPPQASRPSLAASAPDSPNPRARIDASLAALASGDYAGARARAAEAVTELFARPAAEQDAAWLALLNAAGRAAFDAQDARTARRAWQRVYEVRSAMLPDEHRELQSARVNLSSARYVLGDLRGARDLEEHVVEVFARTLADDHPDLLAARGNLAETLRKTGDLAGARDLGAKLLEVFSRKLADDHPKLQTLRQNYALTIKDLGDLAGARELEERVLAVRARTLPAAHPDLVNARSNLATTCSALGDLDGARTLLEQVLAARAAALPDDHPDLQSARLNLAVTIKGLGDLAGGRALYEQVLEIYSRTLPDEHPDLQKARLNLGSTLSMTGDLAGARELFERVLAGYSRTLPDDHPDRQAARRNLAVTIQALGDLEGARAIEEAMLEALSRALPGDHPDLQAARQNLAVTLKALGDLERARALEERVLEVRTRTLPDQHRDLQKARMNLAITLGCQLARANHSPGGEGERTSEREGGRERCAELIDALCRAQVHAARAAILGSPGREAEERCASMAEHLDACLSFAQGLGVLEPLRSLEPESFVYSETTRGAALAAAEVTRRAASAPKYAGLRAALRAAGDELAGLAQKGTTSEQFDRARVKRESAERELSRLARELSGGAGSGVDLDVESLAKRLAAGEAAVAFRRYTKFGVDVLDELDSTGQPAVRETSVASLCAFVVRSSRDRSNAGANSAPHVDAPHRVTPRSPLTLVDLGPIAPIEQAARAWREALGAASASRGVGATARGAPSSVVHASGVSLRERIFDPLLPALAGTERIVVVLDDVLHLVPLDALPLDEESLVGDRFEIETRTTLTELWISTEPFEEPGGELVAFGDVAYGAADLGDAKGAPLATAGVKPPATDHASILRGGAWSQGFSALPGTGVEVRGIARCFADQFGGDAAPTLCEHASATRERLLELAPQARYLHIATHGWFARESIRSWTDPEPLDAQSGLGTRMSGEEQVKGMSPMLLCGLALAGANLPENAVGRVPGLVTADELSTLDLSNCELAVLSACDTNVGERRAGQGVASLQKALQMAGARSVITSLWKVPDEATQELMLDFYRRLWVEKKSRHQALWEAKTKLREAKDERGEPKYTTRDWAAWVLTGDPE